MEQNNYEQLYTFTFWNSKSSYRLCKKKQLISYSELCKRVGYGSCRRIGAYIDPVTKFTYDEYGVFISAIVVLKGTDKPSSGFIPMYLERTSDYENGDIIKSQQEKVFTEDWSNLIKLMKQNSQDN